MLEYEKLYFFHGKIPLLNINVNLSVKNTDLFIHGNMLQIKFVGGSLFLKQNNLQLAKSKSVSEEDMNNKIKNIL